MQHSAPAEGSAKPPDEAVAACLSTALRAHVLAGPVFPEHRTASVAFLQFGKFDELIEMHGPEVAARQLDELVRVVQEAADRYAVCILASDIATDGGKLLLYGGVPRAVGDDDERMLLALRHVVERNPQLPVRVGVNRGHVFSGEIGPPYRRTYVAMGDATNLAARLSAKAPWGQIYTTPHVLERSQTRFQTAAVAPFMVKGKLRPVEALEVGPALRASRPQPSEERLPLIGRDRELAVLRSSIAGARDGTGAIVELVGETGSGKSRLLAEARALAREMRFAHVTCETYTQAIPYVAWRDLLRQVLGLTWEDPDDVVLAHLRAHVEETQPELLPWLPLLGIAMGAEMATTPEVEELSADFRTAKLHEVVLRFLAPALNFPTLLQIEHVHLMDGASAALLEALTSQLRASSWVVIVTRRDVEGGFIAADPCALRLELGPLTRDETMALAEGTPEAHVIPPHMLELAVDRSAGSPEFLLDLLSAAAGGSPTLPDSIVTAASARIDSLEPGDRVLVRRAALLGLRFRPDHLRFVLDPGAAEPDEDLWKRLSGIFAHDSDGHMRFKRPALCEVAYDGLPFRLRRELHTLVAHSLEHDTGREIDADPAIVSLHFSLAGDHTRAWKYALIAAERAGARFAHADAARLYRRAIDAGAANGARPAELASAWERLGEALTHVGELRAAGDAFTAARRLSGGDPIIEARLCFRHVRLWQRSEMSAAVRWVRRGLRTLENVPDPEARAWRARLIAELGWIRQRQRRYAETERLCREALREGEAIGELHAQARACYTLDWALFELGRSEEATYSARALEIYRQVGDPQLEAMVLNNLGGFAYWGGRWEEAADLYIHAGKCSARAGNAADVAFTDGNVGEILSDQGRLEDAETHLRRAHRVWSATGDRQGVAFANMLLGRLAVRKGRHEEGVALLNASATEQRKFRLGFYADLADALVVEGEALGGDPTRALAGAGELLAMGNSNVSLLRRSRGIALARIGDRDSAARELEASVAAARARCEDYEVALSLDALIAVGRLDEDLLMERDTICGRLGVVRLPTIPRLSAEVERETDLALPMG
jgi:class 3 adenylate cyclase/tetratricopeptide (TPR) repeat protein